MHLSPMPFLVKPTGYFLSSSGRARTSLPLFCGGAEQSKNEPNQMIVRKFLPIVPCDAAEPWQLGSQDAATPMMQAIINHDIFFFLILMSFFYILLMESSGFSRHLSLPTSSNPTSDNNENERKKREAEKNKIQDEIDQRLVEEIDHYLDRYKNEIIHDFPQVGTYADSQVLIDKFKKAILADEVPSNSTLPLLREAKRILFKDLNEIDSFRGNTIYSSLVILLREYR